MYYKSKNSIAKKIACPHTINLIISISSLQFYLTTLASPEEPVQLSIIYYVEYVEYDFPAKLKKRVLSLAVLHFYIKPESALAFFN